MIMTRKSPTTRYVVTVTAAIAVITVLVTYAVIALLEAAIP